MKIAVSVSTWYSAAEEKSLQKVSGGDDGTVVQSSPAFQLLTPLLAARTQVVRTRRPYIKPFMFVELAHSTQRLQEDIPSDCGGSRA